MTILDVLWSAAQASIGTLWFVLGFLTVFYGAPGRFHL